MKALLALIFLASLLTTTQAATRYLNAAAVGANNGTTEVDGWTSVASLSAGLANGDTLIVSPGTYGTSFGMTNKLNVTVTIKAGSTTPAIFTHMHLYNCDNLLIDGDEGGLPLIKLTGRDTTYGHTINVRKTQPAVLRGIEVDRAATNSADTAQQHALRSWDQSGDLTIEDCYFHHTSGDGVNISQSTTPTPGREYDWNVVRNTTIQNVADDGVQSGDSWVLLEGNYIDNGNEPSRFGAHPDGFQLNPDRRYATIRNNTFKGFNQNVFIEYTAGEIYIYNNILIGTKTNSADRALNYSTRALTGKFVFANNTVFNFLCYQAMNGGGFAGIPVDDLFFANNLFVNCKTLSGFDAAQVNATNFYFDLPGVQYYDTSGGAVSTPSDRKAGLATYANPLLVDPAGGNFAIGVGSPAIGAATNASAFFTTDFAGTVRSLPYDSGAYEYGTAGTNAAPVVTVTSPADGTTSTVAAVTFTGTATDAEDGALSSGITWTSSLDGAIGTGASVTPTLTAGTHTITASRTDAGALTTTASISITINPPSATFNVETLSVSRMRVIP